MVAEPNVVIPTYADPFYSERVTLDGVVYNLHFRWHTREGRWYFSIHDVEDTPLLVSIKLLTDWPIAVYQKARGLPPGTLIVSSTNADKSPPRLDDFGIGKRCEFNYFPVGVEVTAPGTLI